MPQRYDGRIEVLRRRITEMVGEDPVQYVERPGGGESPRYILTGGWVAVGGAQAQMYLAGMEAGILREQEARSRVTEEATT